MNIFKLLKSKINYSYLSSNILVISRSKSYVKNTFQAKMFDYLLRVQDSRPSSAATFAKPQILQQFKSKGFVFSDSIKNCEVLEILHLQMRESPKDITRTKVYNEFMANVKDSLQCEKLDKNDLIKLLFYIGLEKKTLRAQLAIQAVVLRLKDCLNDLSLEDSCILANTIFKTSTTNLDPTVISHINTTLNTNFKKAIADPSILICFIKILRQFKLHDYYLLDKLTNSSKEWAQNFTVKAHILALFAESKYYDRRFLELMVSSGLEDLTDFSSLGDPVRTHLTSRSRAKDLARFLWAIGALGWRLEASQVQQVVWPQLLRRLDSEFKKQPAVLVDCLLSLCVMGHYSRDLTAWVFSSQVQQVLRGQNKSQPWGKLRLLLAAAKIECPHLVSGVTYQGPQLPELTVGDHVEHREPLQRVLGAVQCLAPSLGLRTPPTCSFQVEPLHVAGIILQTPGGREVHLEVLDPSVCLLPSPLPSGLMKLKLRLLERRGLRVITLEQTQLSEDDAMLFMWIEDQVKELL